MGLLQSYSSILVSRPTTVLVTSFTSVLLLFVITTFLHPLQSFDDPLLGFEARNTPIATKINTWNLLNDDTIANANNISLVPNSHRYDSNYQFLGTNRQYHDQSLNQNKIDNGTEVEQEPPIVEMSTQQINSKGAANNNSLLDEFEDEYYQMVNATIASPPSLIHYSLDSTQAFCGNLYEGYAQVVFSPSAAYSHLGLFNLNSLLAICQLDRRLRLEQSTDDHAIFHRECEQFIAEVQDPEHTRTTACCNSWSLPNHIACLSNKTDCMQLDARDLKMTEHLIKYCAPYYYRAPYEECFTNQQRENNQHPSTTTITTTTTTTTTTPLQISLLNPLADHLDKSYCGKIPDKCLKCGGWIFNVLHFLTNDNFLRNKPLTKPVANSSNRRAKSPVGKSTSRDSASKELDINKLTYTNLFLPVAKSSSLLRYYHTLSKYNLKTPYAQVKVLNLGLKNSLFEHLVSDDIKLFIMALISILLVISIYTWSFLLSITLLIIICLSLCLSYTIYELILDIPIFPFMNLLAVVISFGICSDNAMLFCKQWTLEQDSSASIQVREPTGEQSRQQKAAKGTTNAQIIESNLDEEFVRIDRMLKKAFMSTFAATFATACSFIISAITKVIAVRCFCIFATLSVITNYMLIVLLLPPALILDFRLRKLIQKKLKQSKCTYVTKVANCAREYRAKFLNLGELVHQRWIFEAVVRLKFYLIITFVALLTCASILVFRTGLQPSDDDDIQLLSKNHELLQYNRHLKEQFAFERAKQGQTLGTNVKLFQETPETLPIRVVFGITPADNGNHYDPQDRGHLVFDTKFDLSDENSQIWLLEFCHKLRQQRFIHPSSMLELSSCFIDTFKSWMETRTCHDPVHTGYDRSPCCQSFEFPFSQYVLDRCIGEAISIMRKTPHLYSNTNAGVRFYKNSTRVAALIVEFSSNRLYTDSFTKMERFYHDVNEWVNWHINNTAPAGLRSGWFISSNLELLALQSELDRGTNISVLLEILFAMLALAISTQDLVLTVAGTLTIGAIIVIVLATLILLRWTLGVAESILISLTIGLSIDFALHYSVAYSEGVRTRASHGVLQRILREVGSPIALATMTTSLAGFVIVWSDILAYRELGIFLMLIALVSWLTSTFFLLPMLATLDAVQEYCDLYFRMVFERALKLVLDRI